MHHKLFPRTAAAAALVLAASLGATGTATAAPGTAATFGDDPEVLVTGLSNPRQLDVGKRNAIYIAESGHGGDNCPGDGFCFGDTSRISVLHDPLGDATLSTVFDGMGSGAYPNGGFSTGTHAVSVGPNGRIYALNTSGPSTMQHLTGTLFTVDANGADVVADITAYEFEHDPDGQGPESNPYAVLSLPGRVLVADAAGNDIIEVNNQGEMSVFAVLPNITTGACEGRPNQGGTTGCDFVPSALAEGKGGTVYVVGEAAGVAGQGVVWKFNRKGELLQTWTGFDSPIGITVDKDGTFYVSELMAATGEAVPGKVTKVTADGRTSTPVPYPAGLAIVGDSLFVAAYGIAPPTGLVPGDLSTSGQIWRMGL